MDTHIARHPTFDPDGAPLSARLPGETRLRDHDPRIAPPEPVRPGSHSPEPTAPEVGQPLPRSAEPRSATPGARRRGHPLLWGVSLLALGGVGAAGFLVSPYNHLYPVPRMVTAARSAAASAGVKLPANLLAPSASLASVTLPPKPSAVRDPYEPAAKGEQKAEVLSLHVATDPDPVTPAESLTVNQPSPVASATLAPVRPAPLRPANLQAAPQVAPASPSPVLEPGAPPLSPVAPVKAPDVPATVRTGMDAHPSVYANADPSPVAEVAREPGLDAADRAPDLPFPPDATADTVRDAVRHASEPVATPAAPSGEGTASKLPLASNSVAPSPFRPSAAATSAPLVSGTAAMATSRPVSAPSDRGPSTSTSSSPDGVATFTPISGIPLPGLLPTDASKVSGAVSSAPDALEVARLLRPGPLTPADQVQVINMVTEMSSMVREMKRQNGQLRSDLARSSFDTARQLADFNRRIAIFEAHAAMAAARDAGDGTDAASGTNDAGVAVKPVSFGSLRAPDGSDRRPATTAPAKTAGSAGARGGAAGTAPSGAKLYRVQAASPGLALLAEVARGGGDGAQVQVQVGDTLDVWGRVLSIAQRGSAWVIKTEHGDIQ